MIYLLMVQTIVFGAIIWLLITTGRDERRELELKLLAVCNPPAAVHVESIEKGLTSATYTMDDQAMIDAEAERYAAQKSH
jgi:hypothetical protein